MTGTNNLSTALRGHFKDELSEITFSRSTITAALNLPPDGVELKDLRGFVTEILTRQFNAPGLDEHLKEFFTLFRTEPQLSTKGDPSTLDAVRLTRFEIGTQEDLSGGPFFVGLQLTGQSLELPDSGFPKGDKLAVKDAGFTVGYLGAGASFQVEVYGTLGILGVELSVSVSWPGMYITGSLVGEAIQVKELLAGLGLKTEHFALAIDTLFLSADTINKTYDFSIGFGEWTIPGTPDLVLRRAGTELAYEDGKPSGTVQGEIALQISDEITLDVAISAGMQEGHFDFAGRVELEGVTVDTLANGLAHLFGVETFPLPNVLADLEIQMLGMEFNTGTEEFTFECQAASQEGSQPQLDVEFKIDINHKEKTREIEFRLLVGERTFELESHKEAEMSSFAATYVHEESLRLKDVVAHVLDDTDLVPDLKVDFRDVVIAHLSKMEGGSEISKTVFEVALKIELPLPELPLLGKQVFDIETLEMFYANNEITGKEAEQLNARIGESATNLPAPRAQSGADDTSESDTSGDDAIALNKGFNLVAKLMLGGETLNLSTVGPRSAVGEPTRKKSARALSAAVQESKSQPESTTAGESKALAPTSSTSPDPAPSGNAQWIAIQKAVGPLYFDKIGVRYEAGELWLLLNADLTMGGLTLMLDGLALSSPLDTFDPSFHLHGLGLDYQKPPLEIGGLFARFDDRGHEEYAGLVVVKTEALSLSALGAYTKDAEGHPSMFIYMTLDKPLGGPPFFFVTGLAGGIGFNRALKVPPVEELAKFPFVVQAMSASPAAIPDAGGPAAMASSLDEQLNAVKEYVPPEAGQFWLAAGVKFTSFEIVDGFVLLTVSFGHRFEMHLLGEGTYAYPPGSNKTGIPLTKIKVDIKASYLPDEGLIEMKAVIADGSFLYHPDCHLTGGIAFRSWFSGPRKDEFVLTIGGYHPKFKVPAEYPRVPRLGFNWQYSDALSVKGGAYFAMTGHVLMAGGFLDANWDSGSLRAWFKASADFLVRYKPFHYDIDISVEIGASVTIHFFGTHHLTVSLGADLHLEGPDFSGVAHLHIWVASFTIHFGAGPEGPKPLPWYEFRQSFLPKSNNDIVGVSAQSGLVKSLKGRKLKQDSWEFEDAEQASHWVMNAPEFALAVNSMIPANEWTLPGSEKATGAPFGIAPMDLRVGNEDVTSEITFTVDHDGEGKVTEDFVLEPVRRSVPAGMWGNQFLPDVNSDSVVTNVVTGFRVAAGPKTPPEQTHDIDRKNLAFDTDLLKDAYTWNSDWDKFMPSGDFERADHTATVDKLEERNRLLASFDLPADVQLEKWTGVADESELLAMPISV